MKNFGAAFLIAFVAAYAFGKDSTMAKIFLAVLVLGQLSLLKSWPARLLFFFLAGILAGGMAIVMGWKVAPQ